MIRNNPRMKKETATVAMEAIDMKLLRQNDVKASER